MMALAHFYGWSLADIRLMNMFEMEQAVFYMNKEKQREARRNGN